VIIVVRSPIALFVYNRPWHARQAVEALQKNELAKESELIVYCDGAKSDGDEKEVLTVRDYIDNITGFQNLTVIKKEQNLGLAESIITGVTELCERYGRVIVVEDDLVASPHFLAYVNEALARYADDDRVMQISGYMFPVELHAATDAVFLPFTTCWGWGTWQRSWRRFDPHMAGHEKIKADRKLKYLFDLEGSYSYFDMLEAQMRGGIDSWAIRWYLSVFLLGGLTLHPAKSLIKNIGFDSSGTHCKDAGMTDIIDPDFAVTNFPGIQVSEAAKRAVYRYLAGRNNVHGRFMSKLRRWIC
jgi:hypothetical protein